MKISKNMKNMKIMNLNMALRRTLSIAAFPLCLITVVAIATHSASAQNANQQGQMGNQMGNQNSLQRPDHPRPNFADAASRLGITEAELKTALGIPATPPTNGERPPRPDFADAAAKLGITETQLKDALRVPEGRGDQQANQRSHNQASNQQGQMRNQNPSQRPEHRHPDFASAAAKLGITEAELKAALGVPATPPTNGERPPRPDFADAAAKLGITETQLTEALGIPEGRGDRHDGKGHNQMGQAPSGDRPSMPPQ
jgi:hypothetical protein